MLKILVTVLFLFLSFLQAAEDEYTFKAKGEFAKELKSLMEKYAKEGKVEIQKVDNFHQRETPGMIKAFLNEDTISGDIAYGRKIYEDSCIKCHGKDASKSTYPNARILSTLSKKELVEQLEGYSKDADFGKSTKAIMRQEAVGMLSYDLVSVASYIYSIKHSNEENIPVNATQQEDNEAKSSYLQ